METNFRVYAYSTSKLHCEILRLFSRYAPNIFCNAVFYFHQINPLVFSHVPYLWVLELTVDIETGSCFSWNMFFYYP